MNRAGRAITDKENRREDHKCARCNPGVTHLEPVQEVHPKLQQISGPRAPDQGQQRDRPQQQTETYDDRQKRLIRRLIIGAENRGIDSLDEGIQDFEHRQNSQRQDGRDQQSLGQFGIPDSCSNGRHEPNKFTNPPNDRDGPRSERALGVRCLCAKMAAQQTPQTNQQHPRAHQQGKRQNRVGAA